MTGLGEILSEAASAIKSALPDNDTAKVIADVAATVAAPTIPLVVNDLIEIHALVEEVKGKLAGKHPSAALVFQALFNLA